MRKIVLFLFRVLFFAFIFFLLNFFLDIKTFIKSVDIYLGYPFLCLIALVFGPIYGALSGALGLYFVSAAGGNITWEYCALIAINIAAVGMSCRKMDIKNGFFGKKEVFCFVRSLFLVNFGSWLIFGPTARVWGKGLKNYAEIPISIPLTYFFSGMLVGTLLIAMYARSRLSALNFYRS